MSQLMTILAALAAANLGGSAQADEDAVRAAVADYVEAIYQVQPERIARSVSPEMDKLGYMYRTDGTADWVTMSYSQLEDLARSYNLDGTVPADAPKAIEILDMLPNIASAKLTASWGVDYLLLAKGRDGRWKIRQVLWEGRP